VSEYGSTSVPVEVYFFEIAGIGVRLYTSDNVPQLAQTINYQPLPGLKSSKIPVPTNSEAVDITIQIPASHSLTRLVGLFSTPAQVKVTLKRYQRTDMNTPVLTWVGIMKTASVKGGLCTMQFPSAMATNFGISIPKEAIQSPCNWTLFDSRCKLSNAAFRITAMGSNIAYNEPYGQQLGRNYVLRGTFASNPYNLETLKGGTIRVTTGGRSETRTINAVFKNNGSLGYSLEFPSIIQLNEQLSAWTDTSSVEVLPGCDNSLETCKKYINVRNHGGFPLVPTEKMNPFRVDMSRVGKK